MDDIGIAEYSCQTHSSPQLGRSKLLSERTRITASTDLRELAFRQVSKQRRHSNGWFLERSSDCNWPGAGLATNELSVILQAFKLQISVTALEE